MKVVTEIFDESKRKIIGRMTLPMYKRLFRNTKYLSDTVAKNINSCIFWENITPGLERLMKEKKLFLSSPTWYNGVDNSNVDVKLCIMESISESTKANYVLYKVILDFPIGLVDLIDNETNLTTPTTIYHSVCISEIWDEGIKRKITILSENIVGSLGLGIVSEDVIDFHGLS